MVFCKTNEKIYFVLRPKKKWKRTSEEEKMEDDLQKKWKTTSKTKKWKKTSKKMDNDLKKNGRQPYFFLKIKDNLNFFTLEGNQNVLKMEDDFTFI